MWDVPHKRGKHCGGFMFMVLVIGGIASAIAPGSGNTVIQKLLEAPTIV